MRRDVKGDARCQGAVLVTLRCVTSTGSCYLKVTEPTALPSIESEILEGPSKVVRAQGLSSGTTGVCREGMQWLMWPDISVGSRLRGSLWSLPAC